MSGSQIVGMGFGFFSRWSESFDQSYQNILKEGPAILKAFGLAEEDSEKSVEAERVRNFAYQIMGPIGTLRTAGVVLSLATWTIADYTPILSSLMPFYSLAWKIISIACVCVTYDCHQVHTELRILDRWLIGRIDKNVSWNELFPQIKACFYLIQGSTWFLSRSRLFGRELAHFPIYLDKVKESYGVDSSGSKAQVIPFVEGSRLLSVIDSVHTLFGKQTTDV